MIAKYIIDSNLNLLVEVFHGEIYLKELDIIINEQMKNADFKSVSKVLTDSRLANILLNPMQIDEYIKGLKVQIEEINLVWAIVVNDPHSTALSFVIKNDSFFKNRVGVFSSIEAASDFLLLNLSQKDLDTYEYTIIE